MDKILLNLKRDFSYFQIKVSTKQSDPYIFTATKDGPFRTALKMNGISLFVFFWLANAQIWN